MAADSLKFAPADSRAARTEQAGSHAVESMVARGQKGKVRGDDGQVGMR